MIERDAFLIYTARSFRQYPGPGQGEAEDAKAQGLGQHQIILITMVKITGDSRLAPTLYLTLPAGEDVPDRLSLAVAVPGAFILYGRHRHSPCKIISEFLGYQFVQVCHHSTENLCRKFGRLDVTLILSLGYILWQTIIIGHHGYK